MKIDLCHAPERRAFPKRVSPKDRKDKTELNRGMQLNNTGLWSEHSKGLNFLSFLF